MVVHPNLTEYCYELDAGIAGSMPDSWDGHARMAAYEEAKELPDSATAFAVALANRMAGKKDAPADSIATAAVQQTRDKFL